MYMKYKGDNDGRGPSPVIWADFPIQAIEEDPGRGIHLFEDFYAFGGTVTSNVGTYVGKSGCIKSYQSSATAWAPSTTDDNGLLVVQTGNVTDNLEGSLAWPGGVGKIAGRGVAAVGRLAFEARIKVSHITAGNIFCGLIAPTQAGITQPAITTSDAMQAAIDMVGFRVLTDDDDGLDAFHKAASQTEVVTANPAQVLVADTFYKVGMVFLPSEGTNGKLTWYVNGSPVGSLTTINATTFPDNVPLIPLFQVMNTGGAVQNAPTIDWMRFCQEAA